MTVYLIILLFSALIALRLLLNIFGTGLRQFPGPTLAKVSDLWRLVELLRSRQPNTFRSLHEKYGTAVRIGPNTVSVSDPRMIDQVYGHKTDFPKASTSDMMQAWKPIRNGETVEGISDTQDKALHARLKRPVANTYSMTSIVSAEPVVDDTIRYLLRRLDDVFISKGLPCDIDNWVQYYAFDVIAELTFSRRLGFLESGADVDGMLDQLDKEFEYRAVIGQMPWLHKLLKKNPLYLLLAKPSNHFFTHVDKLVDNRTHRPSFDTEHADMYSRFSEAKKTHPDIVDDSLVRRYIFTNLLAGSDTTAGTLRAIIYYVLANPLVQYRLREEIDQANLSYPVSFKAAQSLPYLDAVIKEGLRIHPIGGFSLERVVPAEGASLPDGRKLPGGTIIAMSAWNLHFDRVFGEDVDTFNPDRWLQYPHESADHWQSRLGAMKRADFAFSRGPRVCLGRHIAILEIYKLIPTLFGVFDMKLAQPERPWKVEHRFFSRQSEMDVVLRWRKGVGEKILSSAH